MSYTRFRKSFFLLLLFFSILSTATCFIPAAFAAADSAIPKGAWQGSRYINEDLGIDLNLPSSWIFLDEATIQKLSAQSLDIMVSDTNKKKSLSNAFQRATIPFYITKFPVGTPDNVCMVFSIERNSPEYPLSLEQIIQTLKREYSNLAVELLIIDDRPETLSNQPFRVLENAIIIGKTTVRQQQYITLRKNYIICFTLTSTTDEGYREIRSLMRSIRIRP